MIKKTILTFLLVACVASNAMAQDVKVAIFPSNDPKKLYTVMSVLADYLSSSTGDRVTAVVTRDYMELAQRLKEETVDIAWINTLNYVKIKNEIPSIKYIATYMELNADTGKIMPFYQSYIVTHKQSGITSLEQARGKLFAFTDPGSTSGYAYPNMLLTKQGIIPDQYFGKVFFLKKHDRVIEALLKGAIDVGAVSDGTYFNAARNHGDKFVILAKSDPIPLDAVVAPGGASEEFVAKYRQALTSMPSDHAFCRKMREVLGWSAAGFEARGDSFYDTVRQALKQ